MGLCFPVTMTASGKLGGDTKRLLMAELGHLPRRGNRVMRRLRDAAEASHKAAGDKGAAPAKTAEKTAGQSPFRREGRYARSKHRKGCSREGCPVSIQPATPAGGERVDGRGADGGAILR